MARRDDVEGLDGAPGRRSPSGRRAGATRGAGGRPRGRRRWGPALAAVTATLIGTLTGGVPPAHAYDYWTRARTSGEAYELRGFRVVGGELMITRRRFTQGLTLVIHDIGDLERKRRRAGRLPGRGPVVSWQSYLRLDQDYGTWVTGRLYAGPTRRQDALDLIPEVGESAFALDLLFGHLSIDGLFDGRLELQLGRIVPLDGTGALPVDGLAVRGAVTEHLEVRASGGLAVRAHSPLGVAADELDGPPGAGCREYVEAAAGQRGRWLLIDRSRVITDGRYSSDFEACPQREVAMPTLQLALVARGFASWRGEVGYRIARSPTVGLIGAVDRLATPDLGLYPNEQGQAPSWGTNLEQVYATADGAWRRGALTVRPRALVRASLVHGVLDRAEASAAVQRARHTWTPSAARQVPTFDADSIWNAFGAAPSLDLRLDYRYLGRWQGLAAAWARRYDGGAGRGAAWAWGGTAELMTRLSHELELSARTIADAGYGGQRLGVHGEVGWRRGRAQAAGRGAVAWARGDDTASAAERATVSATAAAAATVRLADGVAVHSMLELRRASGDEVALRALAVVDFALESGR